MFANKMETEMEQSGYLRNMKKTLKRHGRPQEKVTFSFLMITLLWLMMFSFSFLISNYAIAADKMTTEAFAGQESVVSLQETANETIDNKQGNASKPSKEEMMSRKYLIGGHSIGIVLQTHGAAVVGFSTVQGEDGKQDSPAKAAGLLVGDFIIKVNETSVTTDDEIGKLINELGENGQKVTLTVKRENEELEIPVTPKKCQETGTWRIGLYIRDSTAGVGTLTFYEPQSQIYGALGHYVADLEDRLIETEEKGSILSAEIQSVKTGKKGEPGEKIGVFSKTGLSGNILTNSTCGIFGRLEDSNLENQTMPELVSIAKVDEVKTGPAQIITVVNGDKMQVFDVEISKLMPKQQASGKGMVLQVTDPELLEQTGGIIQGMSGSPIIQNGKIVGAVTHVFVNDPTSGYGCFAEWMVEEAVK